MMTSITRQWRLLLVVVTLAFVLRSASSESFAATPNRFGDRSKSFLGHWALVMPNGAAGWLTLSKADSEWKGELRTVGGGRNLTQIQLDDSGQLRFVRRIRVGQPEYVGGPPAGPRVDCVHFATVEGDRIRLRGQLPTVENQERQAKTVRYEGRRMPPLPPKPDLAEVKFGEPIELFNGRNLDGWMLTNSKQLNGWKAIDGELVNTTPKLGFDPYSKYGNLRTKREFGDCRLTLEFNVPKGGNSGVYVRGQYEAQVVDRDSRMQGIQGVGAIFGRIAPSENAGLGGDRWQRYDITIVDRHATVVLNGVKVIDNQPITGCTNGALHADVTKPGPLYLQGDHTAVRYRNIVIRPVVND